MRMVYTGADEEDFIDARRRLLVELDAWSEMRQRVVDPVVAGALLDYRFERDGLLGRWTREVLRGALLTWFPRKVVLLDPHSSAVLSTVEALLDFFDDADLFDDRSEPPGVLRTFVRGVADRFDEAMREPSNFGLAKFWAVAMAEHGVDPLDEFEAQEFLDRVQEGEVEVDQELLQDIAYRHYEGDTEVEPLEPTPVFALASDQELTGDAAETRVVRRLRRFVDWVGDGRELAAKGRLAESDARDLADRLDEPDPTELVSLAKTAGVVRVLKGRLVRVKRAAPLLEDPLALWRVAVPHVVADCREPLRRSAERQLAYELLESIQADNDCATIPMLIEILDDLGDLNWRCADATPVLRVLGRLADFGLVELFPATEEHYEDLLDFAGVDSVDDVPEEERQVVRMRPLGTRVMYDARVQAGIPTLTLGDLAGETAEVFLARVGPLPQEAFEEGARLWLRARHPERAIAELSEVARRTDDFEHRMLAFQLLAEYGEQGVSAISELRDHSAAGPAALSWLLDAGLIDPSEVRGRERTYGMVDVLAAGIRSAGRKKAMEEFAAQPRQAQLLFLADATICGHPHTREVLESMVLAHPDRAVSNAARKALDWLHEPEG
ncbi:hypothetical protein FHX82_000297 [Amycolatopsis bartoniae]|uniref:Uncharacterized protein n=1 Tax=Amycolatopsis bartoniae TaxID=941986 RepID=A0A8H9J140_9PSEU|nr:hypothetical protein [Amycolatopsis bartoniae]MBB2933277.1 hypothetical protein [Amycolatopsis bartoniae]GHF58342.1 hypothetical protein GCM10017566_34610 [Amycolatopsis bartoniae]